MKYYISDCHFLHGRIKEIDHRDFNTLFEMEDFMIKQWNNKVTNDDDVYIIGDFCWGNGVQTWDIYSKLNGHLHLIEGNHDYWYLDDPEFVDTILEEIIDYKEVIDGKRNVILSHYPIPFYNHQFDQDENNHFMTYMLYGHVHSLFDEYLINNLINQTSTTLRSSVKIEEVTTPMQMINTFCVYSNYVPLSLDEWIEVDKKRRQVINDAIKQNNGSLDYKQWDELSLEIVQLSKKGWK